MADRPLSFCMVTTFYPPYHFGGDAAYAYHLTNALARRGHAVTVVHSADAYRALGGEHAGEFEHAEGVTVRRLETRSPRGAALATYLSGRPLVYARQLREAMEGTKFDVIHFHNTSLVGGPGVLGYGDAVKLYTTSEHWLVCPMHVLFRYNREPCVEPHCLRCTLAFRRPPQLWRYSGLLERSVRHVDLFLSPSRFTLDAHRARGFTAPMRHLPYFVDAEEEHEPGAGPAAATRPYFLYVGRLERLKGVHVLIEAFRDYRDADLLIAGEGEFGEDLRRQAAGLEHVRFLGRLHPSQLRPLYRGAVALLVSSIGYEVFAIVALEAFAQRTPAIAHDLGALTEVIGDSKGGMLYRTPEELRAAMDLLLRDTELRRRLGDQGHEAWQRLWTEEPHMQAYFAAIEDARVRTAVTAVVLTYHAVEDGPAPLCIEPDLFRAQLDCLVELGAETLTISGLAARLRDGTLPARAVAITFDDGCASVVRTAAPLLAERGLTATVFCVAGHLGGRNDWPTQPAGMPSLELAGADELVELHRAGVEIGAHGVEHAPLDTADAPTAERELRKGRAVLEEIVGSPVRSLAYPYGAEPAPAVATLVSELYDAACTARPAHVRPASDQLYLPRVDVHYLRRPALFRRVVSGGLEPYLRARGAVTAWRRRGRA